MNSAPSIAFIATARATWLDLQPRAQIGYGSWTRRWSKFDAFARRLIVSLIESTSAEAATPVVSALDWSDIQATLKGSSDAYAQLVSRYQQIIGAQMWRFTKNPATYEDLVHDVFVEAYLSLRQFRGKAPFIHWLRKIAVRVGYRHWKEEARRRSKSNVSMVERESPPSPDETVQSEASARLHFALTQLSPRDRLVVTLVHLEQRSLAEAADLLGWSTTMVKVQAFRARKKIKKILQRLP